MKSRFKIKNVHFGHFHKNRKKDREAYLHDVKGSSCRSLSSFKMCLEAIPKLQRKKKQNLKRAYFIYKLKGGRKSKRKQPKQLWQSNSITEASKSKIVIIFLLQQINSYVFSTRLKKSPMS